MVLYVSATNRTQTIYGQVLLKVILALVVQTSDVPCMDISIWETDSALYLEKIYLEDSINHLAPVVQKLDSAIHQINHYPVDKN